MGEVEEEVKEDEDDEPTENEDVYFSTFGSKLVSSFHKRCHSINSKFTVLAWILALHTDTREDVKQNFRKSVHEEPVDRVVTKIYAHDDNADIAGIINIFCKEGKICKKDNDMYEKWNIWYVKDAREGNSII